MANPNNLNCILRKNVKVKKKYKYSRSENLELPYKFGKGFTKIYIFFYLSSRHTPVFFFLCEKKSLRETFVLPFFLIFSRMEAAFHVDFFQKFHAEFELFT